mmetsp:Transcript_22776/g.33920  ORF Transcript_22776/g.33920 Transcript_22776/m.33920 type:complete len:107 (-) Transcript_22776:412-732(-)
MLPIKKLFLPKSSLFIGMKEDLKEKKTDCDTSETANDPPAASPISSRPVTALQSNYNNSQPKNERVPIVNLQCITDNTLFPGADMWDVEDCASVVPSVASSKRLST